MAQETAGAIAAAAHSKEFDDSTCPSSLRRADNGDLRKLGVVGLDEDDSGDAAAAFLPPLPPMDSVLVTFLRLFEGGLATGDSTVLCCPCILLWSCNELNPSVFPCRISVNFVRFKKQTIILCWKFTCVYMQLLHILHCIVTL